MDKFERLRYQVLVLRNEVNCRVEHGAESDGHLEYVESALNDILKNCDHVRVEEDDIGKL